MSPDDPRHGTANGYKTERCRCIACTQAMCRYEKRRKWLVHQGLNPSVPAIGFQRRVQALMAIGWPQSEIADALGIARGNLSAKLRAKSVYRATHLAMCAVYEERCMTVRRDPISRRSAGIAATRGFAPPLAWDDIDNDTEPHIVASYAGPDVDPVVVMRLLEGERVPSTKAEKEAAMTRWVADGAGSRNELARMHGWKSGRYAEGLRLVRDGAA